MAELRQVLNRYAAWGEPHAPGGADDLQLGNRLGLPASRSEIELAWPDGVDPEAAAFWSAIGSGDLFQDVQYGQWGLHLLTPAESTARSALERIERPDEMADDDIVIGEFLGDQDLLVLAPSEEGDRRVLVALPLDKRDQWYGVAPSLADFLDRFYESSGEKYWERDGE